MYPDAATLLVDTYNVLRSGELGLDGGGPDGEDGLPGEDGGALGDGPDVPGEAEGFQVLQELRGEDGWTWPPTRRANKRSPLPNRAGGFDLCLLLLS